MKTKSKGRRAKGQGQRAKGKAASVVALVLAVVVFPATTAAAQVSDEASARRVDLRGWQDDSNRGRVHDQAATSEVVTPSRPPAWQTALVDSLKLLAIEHGLRLAFHAETRRELEGPFFRDYVDSLHIPAKWEDGDSWGVNYIGHPIHGAAAGYLYRDAAGVTSQDFSLRPKYWADLGKAGAWIVVYSIQFELGPLSEASIGNVGRDPQSRGWVDHVVTPVMGFALMAAEDALDRFVVQLVERHTRNRFFRATVRMLFNPSRVLSNLAQFRRPWDRRDRPIGR